MTEAAVAYLRADVTHQDSENNLKKAQKTSFRTPTRRTVIQNREFTPSTQKKKLSVKDTATETGGCPFTAELFKILI